MRVGCYSPVMCKNLPCSLWALKEVAGDSTVSSFRIISSRGCCSVGAVVARYSRLSQHRVPNSREIMLMRLDRAHGPMGALRCSGNHAAAPEKGLNAHRIALVNPQQCLEGPMLVVIRQRLARGIT